MDDNILLVANNYKKQYYFNDDFSLLPVKVKNEIKELAIMHVEEVGGIFIMKFSEDGDLLLESRAEEDDIAFDEIGAHLKIKQYIIEKKDLFESLEEFYKTFS